MNLHALRIFVEVASRGSVTTAADALSISQPAVTAQIRKLEQELGIRLVYPEGRGIALTHVGRFLYEKARRIYDWEKEIELQLAEIMEGKRGKLRVASTYLPSHYLLPAWLASYKRQYEQVEVEIRTGNSQQCMERLLQYQADLAVIANESWDERPIRRYHIAGVAYWFIVPPGHPFAGQEVSLEQLMREPFLLREQGSSTRERLYSLCREHGVSPPRVGLQYHGLIESIQSVRAGYGTMLAPEPAVREMVARGEVGRVRLSGIEIKRPVYLCTREDESDQRPTVARFLDMVLGMF
ncbi:LysR substrate-binding domain-containing protein [Brevibacillus sp. H7]|uniref:LysR substrate-binding domain-containing protein n=1 Tax=Brevibacillus sp. H7 TaxID=3349138 RepID=UPI00382C80CF